MLTYYMPLNQQAGLKPLTLLTNKYSGSTYKYEASTLEREISLYESSLLLKNNSQSVLDYYFALSVSTLKDVNQKQHDNKCLRFGRSMSSHEALISERLSDEHGIKHIRQLLVGKSHADFYIPRFHMCIEPSSERYHATSKRARMEKESDWLRIRMNRLQTWRVESYFDTRQTLRRTVQSLSLTIKPLTSQEIHQNLFTIALHTLPHFIPYQDFCSILQTNPLSEPILRQNT